MSRTKSNSASKVNGTNSSRETSKQPELDSNVNTGAIERYDSDDELGDEDLPWEWIYDNTSNGTLYGATPSAPHFNGAVATEDINLERKPIGARLGAFSCHVGDCVLVKAEGTNEAYVGLICELLTTEDGEKSANFMWFSTEKEIRDSAKKRADHLSNELYLCPAWDTNPLASINGKALVMSPGAFSMRFPTGKVPRSSPDYGKVFVCRRGCNVRIPKYTEEFVWEGIYDGTEAAVDRLIQKIQLETKPARKKRTAAQFKRDVDEAFVVDDNEIPSTPHKKRRINKAETPTSGRKGQTPSKLKTPTSKRSVVKKPLEFTPLGTRVLSPAQLSSPFQVARNRLHVSSVPASLPCRETEYALVYSHLGSAIAEGSGTCIYISGTPGTGKTATVREVISQLNSLVATEEMDDFIFVEINGMKITDPHQSYSLLWEAIRGERVGHSYALEQLNREFSTPSPRRVPCVVLMDELDQLVTKNQSVMYNFFNWPGLRHSRLIVLAVANTMDLPERTLSNKISSRLGLTRITFPGYTHTQLMTIIESRLEDVPSSLVDPDAIQFASRKVAAVTGDARRALDICRRAVELAESTAKAGNDEEAVDDVTATPSKITCKPNPQPAARAKVTIATIKQAISEATSSPMQIYLRSLSLVAKLFLAGLLARNRQTGVSDCVLGDVLDQARTIGKVADNEAVQRLLLTRQKVASTKEEQREVGDRFMVPVPRVIGINKAIVDLSEAGVIALESRKGERTGRVRLNVGTDEIILALREDQASKGMGFVSV